MSCTNRRNKRFSDLALVIGLAQLASNMNGLVYKIYKTYCNGASIYNFSYDWKGEAVAEVTPAKTVAVTEVHVDGHDTSEVIFRHTEDGGVQSAKPRKSKNITREVSDNLEKHSRELLSGNQQEEL